MNYKNRIRQFLAENFNFSQGDIQDDTSLRESGIVDSTGVMEIIFFLEEEFSIKVENQDLIPENFDSVTGLEHYLEAKITN